MWVCEIDEQRQDCQTAASLLWIKQEAHLVLALFGGET